MERLMEVTSYSSLEATLRVNDGGDWILDLPSDVEEAELLKAPWRTGIIVQSGDTVLFSGPVTDFTLHDDADGMVEVRGIDDTARLVPVYAYPTPQGPPHTEEYWIYQGAAQDAIYALYDANVGSAARADRRLPGWTRGETSGLGEQITIKAKFDSLLALMAEKCVEGVSLRVEARQSETADEVVFRVLPTGDLRDVILFGIKEGNLSTVTYAEAGAEATVVIVAGEGQGAYDPAKPGSGRTVIEVVDEPQLAEYGRIEAFRDERRARQDDETEGQYEATLRQAGEQELSDRAGGYDVELEVADDDGARFGVDYGLGDLVSVRVGDLRLDATVVEVSLRVTDDGATWTPRVTSTGGAKPDSRHVNSIARKLSRIQTQIENPTDIQWWRRSRFVGEIFFWTKGPPYPALCLVCDGSAGTPDLRDVFPCGSGPNLGSGRQEGVRTIDTSWEWSISFTIPTHEHRYLRAHEHQYVLNHEHQYAKSHDHASLTVNVSSGLTALETPENDANTEVVASGTGTTVSDKDHQHAVTGSFGVDVPAYTEDGVATTGGPSSTPVDTTGGPSGASDPVATTAGPNAYTFSDGGSGGTATQDIRPPRYGGVWLMFGG